MDLNMFNVFKVYGARLLSFALCLSIAAPLRAQNFPKHLEKEFRRDATEKVTKFVKIFNSARIEYEKKGAQAFVNQLELSAPKSLTQEEKSFIAKRIARIKLLPTLEVNGDRLIGIEAGKEVFNLSTFDVAQGKFAFKDQTLIYQNNKRLIKNYEDWTNNKISAKSSSYLDYVFYKIENFFFPQAHAFSKMTGAIFGAIGGFFLVMMWPKIQAWFTGKSENTASVHSGGDQLPPLPAPAPAPPPAPTEEKKADDPLTAPLPKDENEKAADTTPASEETKTPKTTPELSEAGKIRASANDFIAEKFPASEVSDLDSLREYQSHTNYPKDACSMLKKLHSALLATEKNQIEKPVAKKVLEALVKNSEGKDITTLPCKETVEKINVELAK